MTALANTNCALIFMNYYFLRNTTMIYTTIQYSTDSKTLPVKLLY